MFKVASLPAKDKRLVDIKGEEEVLLALKSRCMVG